MTFSQSCPECKQTVAGGVAKCPQCGFPLVGQTMGASASRFPPPGQAPRNPVPVFDLGAPNSGFATLVAPLNGIKLWNPNAASVWSLLLTPAFGAYLHALNWRTLGRPDREAANMAWVWMTVAFYGIYIGMRFLHLPIMVFTVMNWVSLAMLVIWNSQQAIPQVKLVKETLGNRYSKRSWGAPLLSGVLGIVLLIGFLSVLPLHRTNAELAEELKPLILKEWQKHSELSGATINNVTLVQKNGNTYTGLVEANIAGKEQSVDLEVTYDGNSLKWQTKLPGN
ncbi:MAG: Uncharacterized protein JWL77_4871 [Chthonomonadaceae bacterium]|nr:Uncharacterized protein [Chthonomonadaceae bacterium]